MLYRMGRLSNTNICFILYNYWNPITTYANMWKHEENTQFEPIEMVAKIDIIKSAIEDCQRKMKNPLKNATAIKWLRSLVQVIFVSFCFGAPITAQ